MTYEERLRQIVEIGYSRLCGKISGGRISVDNEASLQLQLASILKSIGELYEETPLERFSIELEKEVKLKQGTFKKSGTSKAKIDIWLSIENIETKERHACALELKHFKKVNQREPNNRYEVFKDLLNLEMYGEFVDYGVLIVATDHPHYVNQEVYSVKTSDFDLRDGATYVSGTELVYSTETPHGPPITLKGSYEFSWHKVHEGLNFLFLEVEPQS